MYEYIGIIVGVICILAVAVVGYFLYSRMNGHQITIEQMIHRQRSLEAALLRPPPRQEIKSLYKSDKEDCESCVVKPFTETIPKDDQDLISNSNQS